MRGFDEKLFSMLENHFEAAQIDRGQMAECIGTMVVLLAIDDANLANEPCDSSNIGNLIEDMVSMNPEFDSLWRKKSFILEPDADSNSNSSPICSEFEGYRVCTVESFLETLLSSSKFAEIKNKLPPSTLLGIVNSSHAVKITRTGLDDIQFNRQDYHSMKLPTADNRIDDENCNLIDEALLKLGLIHQCCFFMPDRYFGYDLIIPVMLKDGNFTYIGIQFKAADVSISAPIDKMQARLHFVKCPVSDSNGCHSANCPRCSDLNVRNALKEKFSGIFANQISLLISIDPHDSKSFKTGFKSSFLTPSSKASSEQELQHFLTRQEELKLAELKQFEDSQATISPSLIAVFKSQQKNRFDARLSQFINESNARTAFHLEEFNHAIDHLRSALRTHKSYRIAGCNISQFQIIHEHLMQVGLKGSTFYNPLLSIREPFGNGSLMLASSIWCDDLVNHSTTMASDGFVHRQYCIVIRGLDVFSHLFRSAAPIASARKLLNNDTHFFKEINNCPEDMRRLSMLKSMLHDANLNYVEFNHILAYWRDLGNRAEDGSDATGFRLLMKNQRTFLEKLISNPIGSSDHFSKNFNSRVNWMIGDRMPSKKPDEYTKLALQINSFPGITRNLVLKNPSAP